MKDLGRGFVSDGIVLLDYTDDIITSAKMQLNINVLETKGFLLICPNTEFTKIS